MCYNVLPLCLVRDLNNENLIIKNKNMKNNEINGNPALSKMAVSVSVTDLRIGNLVNHISFGNVVISGCNRDCIQTEYENNTYYDDIRFHTAIPITEELLLKIGAIKLDFKDFPSFNLLGTQINFVNGLWIDYVTRVEIKGLHHLQNIFFFRNSEELKISCLTEH